MKNNLFKHLAAVPDSAVFEQCVSRETPIYNKPDEIRTEFERDYNRILHSFAYRRLKHKTQVFYATTNDHICTRIEHTQHVAAVASTICGFLGLNKELAAAIALGHDLGHAPFGHEGEKVIGFLAEKYLGQTFWHEKNSLKVVDDIETLISLDGSHRNLNLTYAVRDGIISHCGEIDENGLTPRTDAINLKSVSRTNEYAPYTWEACVVKLADKIAYLGRDIEDAVMLGILDEQQLIELETIIREIEPGFKGSVATTGIMHNLIINLCRNSSPETGLSFDNEYFSVIKAIKTFNYKNIYRHPRVNRFNKFAALVINTIFETLHEMRQSDDRFYLNPENSPYVVLSDSFSEWILKYSGADPAYRTMKRYENRIVFDYDNDNSFSEMVLIYISLMSDQYILKIYNEIIKY